MAASSRPRRRGSSHHKGAARPSRRRQHAARRRKSPAARSRGGARGAGGGGLDAQDAVLLILVPRTCPRVSDPPGCPVGVAPERRRARRCRSPSRVSGSRSAGRSRLRVGAVVPNWYSQRHSDASGPRKTDDRSIGRRCRRWLEPARRTRPSGERARARSEQN